MVVRSKGWVRLICVVLAMFIQAGTAADVHPMGTSESPPTRPLKKVWIQRNTITMPVGRIFLVRTDSAYCAVKVTKDEESKSGDDYFAAYESWFQGDGAGDFSKPNVLFSKDELWWKKPLGFGRLWLIRRFQDEIRCGPITLRWNQAGVSMKPLKTGTENNTIHFAPTPWTAISQVNVNDPRITWYPPGDPNSDAPDVRVPIDELWKEKGPEK